MSSTQYLTDAATRHAVFLQRYAGGQSKEATALLMRLRRDINARLSQEPTAFQRERLEAVLRDISGIAAIGFKGIERGQIISSMDLVKSEAAFSTKLFGKAATIDFTLPQDAALIAAVMTTSMAAPLNAGVTIEDALQQFGAKKSKQIAQVITDGVILGDTTPVISQKVGQLINTLQKRQLDALVRTIANHTSSVARSQVYQSNSDIIDGYQWVATLDSKTTFICASRDGKVYMEGVGPMPPAHWNCRSTTIPKVKPEFDIGAKLKGKRPSVGATGAKQVSSRTSYEGWLKKQPREFQDEALGVERARMFRSGKVSLSKTGKGGFIDPTGRTYTLLELEGMSGISMIE